MVIKYLTFCHKSSRGFPKPRRDTGTRQSHRPKNMSPSNGLWVEQYREAGHAQHFLSSLIIFYACKVAAHNIFYRLWVFSMAAKWPRIAFSIVFDYFPCLQVCPYLDSKGAYQITLCLKTSGIFQWKFVFVKWNIRQLVKLSRKGNILVIYPFCKWKKVNFLRPFTVTNKNF